MLPGLDARAHRPREGSQPGPTPRAGYWQIMTTIADVDALWATIKTATEAGDLGYRLQAAGVMDMFPHTAHVESIALFEFDQD